MQDTINAQARIKTLARQFAALPAPLTFAEATATAEQGAALISEIARLSRTAFGDPAQSLIFLRQEATRQAAGYRRAVELTEALLNAQEDARPQRPVPSQDQPDDSWEDGDDLSRQWTPERYAHVAADTVWAQYTREATAYAEALDIVLR